MTGEAGEPTSEALYAAFASGDAGAFDALYARHAEAAEALVRCSCPEDRQEITQSAWLRIIEDRVELAANGETFTRNLSRALMTSSRMLRRGEMTTSELTETHPAGDMSPESAMSIRQIVDRMDDQPREVFSMVVDGLSIREAAAEAGLSRMTAHRRFREALAHLERAA